MSEIDEKLHKSQTDNEKETNAPKKKRKYVKSGKYKGVWKTPPHPEGWVDGRKESCKNNLKKARANNPLLNPLKNVPSGYNSQAVDFLWKVMQIGAIPYDHYDCSAIIDHFRQYVELCNEYDQKLGNLAAYMALGISRETASEWSHDVRHPERADVIKNIQRFCASYREKLGEDGKINPVVLIFWQKNFDGFVDQKEQHIVRENILGPDADAERLEKRYGGASYTVIDAEEIPADSALPQKKDPPSDPPEGAEGQT